MRTLIQSNKLQSFISRLMMAVIAVSLSLSGFAQDTKKVDVNISTGNDGGGGFFASPWVWVVGVAVFILLLVALLRGGSRKEV